MAYFGKFCQLQRRAGGRAWGEDNGAARRLKSGPCRGTVAPVATRGAAVLTLYKAGNSICTQKVLMTLDEKGAPFETVNIDLFKNEQYDPAYLKINPKGVVPSLIDEAGHPVIESTAICEFLDELYPDPPLKPAAPHLRARMRLWSKMIDEGLFEATRELSFSAMFRERLRNMTEAQRQTRFRNVGDPERTARYQSCYAEGVESFYVFLAIASYEKAFAAMEAELADGRLWLVGDDYSLADIALSPFVARLNYLGLLDVWIAERPHVRAWWERARARPSFVRAIVDATGEQDAANMARFGGAIRDRVAARLADYLREH